MIDLDRIKQTVDLVALIRSRGVELKKNGKGYRGLCPFHEDKKTASFSVTPDKGLWHCFGCSKGGDIIEFVRLFDRVDFKAAVEKLTTYLPGADLDTGKAKKPVKKEAEQPKVLTPANIKIRFLSRICG